MNSIILQRLTTHIWKRLYHDSRFKQKLPVVRQSGSRFRNTATQRHRRNSIEPRVEEASPMRTFEPFPFAVTEENKLDVIKRVITPLHDIPYEEQLASKESFCKNALKYMAQELYKGGTPVRLDVKKLPCPVHPIKRAPETHYYRNKDELSIWPGVDGKTNVIGYMAFPIGKHGDTVCIEPDSCDIMKEETIKIVKVLQDFITNQAKLGVCLALGTQGGWRRFIIRNNLLGELMVAGIVSPRTFLVRQVVDERENFKTFMVAKSKEAGLELKSLYFQPCPHNNCMHKDVPYELLYGEKTLEEKVNQFKYMISPESRFHVSTRGAELLYKTVRETINDCFGYKESGVKPLIIDAGCGIGALSFELADMASKVIGVDISSQSIEDAMNNAKANGITNFQGICSNLEIVLERILEKHSRNRQNTLLVCNPSKKGLHSSVVEAIRRGLEVKNIIYITSNPAKEATIDNLIGLCRRIGGKSPPPFAPVSATPVDLYPQLATSELVIALERMPE